MKKDIQRSVEESIQQQRHFRSPTHGELTFKEVIYRIAAFMHEKPGAKYQVVVGTDSQTYSQKIDFVTAIIVYRLGEGGVYFWQRNTEDFESYVLRDRMYKEAIDSMDLARRFMDGFEVEGIIQFDLEIHVDIGKRGETRHMINEVVGMVRGSGFEVRTKPAAYGAANVADRYT